MLANLLGELILGWLLADFLTGLFHWWEDTHQHLADVPVIGPFIIQPNILHHDLPLAFTEHDFWARNRAAMITACIAAAIMTGLFGLQAWIIAMAVGGGLTNEVHRYAHQPSTAGKVLKVLQEIGIMQSPKQHARHHRPPYDVHYFILTDWLNPIAEAIGFWPWLNRIARVKI